MCNRYKAPSKLEEEISIETIKELDKKERSLPKQQLQQAKQLIDAFEWMRENEQNIKRTLFDVMPEYKRRVLEAGFKIRELEEQSI